MLTFLRKTSVMICGFLSTSAVSSPSSVAPICWKRSQSLSTSTTATVIRTHWIYNIKKFKTWSYICDIKTYKLLNYHLIHFQRKSLWGTLILIITSMTSILEPKKNYEGFPLKTLGISLLRMCFIKKYRL